MGCFVLPVRELGISQDLRKGSGATLPPYLPGHYTIHDIPSHYILHAVVCVKMQTTGQECGVPQQAVSRYRGCRRRVI